MDFVIVFKNQAPQLIQICESLADPKTLNREVTALTEAMTELGRPDGLIITLSEEKTITLEKGTIKIIPAWKFLLQEECPYA